MGLVSPEASLSLCELTVLSLCAFTFPLLGTPLGAQWLRLHTLNARGLGSIPDWGTRSHMTQLRLKIPHATTNTWYIQTELKEENF